MSGNGFAKGLIEVLLSWMRLIASWVWNFFQADMGGGFLAWFADHWLTIAIVLIIVGIITDWLIWMIRWRPYWLWLRRRQIIYEDVETPSHEKPAAPRRHMPSLSEENAAIQAEKDFSAFLGETTPDPYAAHPVKKPVEPVDFSEWDIENDPYAVDHSRHTDYDPAMYARPAIGESETDRTPRDLPILENKRK